MHARVIMLAVTALHACTQQAMADSADAKTMCSTAWYESVEKQVPTSNGRTGGPMVGSVAWKVAIERALDIDGSRHVPDRATDGWCRYINEMLRGGGAPDDDATVQDCSRFDDGSIDAMICEDKELSALDQKLAAVRGAARTAAGLRRFELAASERDWLASRNDCEHADNRASCVRDAYYRRIAGLQARYALIAGNGPVSYDCDDGASEVEATFFVTDPPTVIVRRNGAAALLYSVPSGSGARYQGSMETFWEHQGEVRIVWEPGGPEVSCRKVR
jgi:uncharacterized protein